MKRKRKYCFTSLLNIQFLHVCPRGSSTVSLHIASQCHFFRAMNSTLDSTNDAKKIDLTPAWVLEQGSHQCLVNSLITT